MAILEQLDAESEYTKGQLNSEWIYEGIVLQLKIRRNSAVPNK